MKIWEEYRPIMSRFYKKIIHLAINVKTISQRVWKSTHSTPSYPISVRFNGIITRVLDFNFSGMNGGTPQQPLTPLPANGNMFNIGGGAPQKPAQRPRARTGVTGGGRRRWKGFLVPVQKRILKRKGKERDETISKIFYDGHIILYTFISRFDSAN